MGLTNPNQKLNIVALVQAVNLPFIVKASRISIPGAFFIFNGSCFNRSLHDRLREEKKRVIGFKNPALTPTVNGRPDKVKSTSVTRGEGKREGIPDLSQHRDCLLCYSRA
jgi:hypothetical protein